MHMTCDLRRCTATAFLLLLGSPRDGRWHALGLLPCGPATTGPKHGRSQIRHRRRADLRFGTAEDDTIAAGAEAAVFFGLGGDDSLAGSIEADFLFRQ